MLTLTILELHRYHPRDFMDQLKDTVGQSPKFFEQNPIVVSLERLSGPDAAPDLRALAADCKKAGVQLIAFRGPNTFKKLVSEAGCALILAPASARKKGEEKSTPKMQPKPDAIDDQQAGQPEEGGAARPSKTIVQPVRSGQQIYAQGCDLIILGPVSGGAEILADGNIHIYGRLRGRALAGISGDTSARIFCQNMEAELLSIAGVFKISEDLRSEFWQQSVQARLKDGSLQLVAL
jgi:septum site-determining protein MinC